MITAALIGAGVGLVVGAGLGFLVAGLFRGGYIAELEEQVNELGERCDRYVGELDALVEATRPPADEQESWAAEGLRTAGEPGRTPDLSDVLSGRIKARPGFDAHPTILLGPGETYEQWYAAYADRLDQWAPGWWDHMPRSAAPELARLAEERRHETYAQNELDHDRLPTAEGFEQRAFRPNRPGMAIYPKESK